MKLGLLIAMGAAAVVGGTAWTWRRARDRRERRAWCLLPGWTARSDLDALRPRLAMTALSQVGHSRRIVRAVTAPGEIDVFEYACESGFEARRYLHQWLVAIQLVNHGRAPAIFTNQPWLKAVARDSAARELGLSGATLLPDSNSTRTAILESPTDWLPALNGKLGAWLAAQPDERTWEVLPGFVAAHEPGRLDAYGAAALAHEVNTFVNMIVKSNASDAAPHRESPGLAGDAATIPPPRAKLQSI